MRSEYEKKGYLNSNFRLFHLTDSKCQKHNFHYHEFDKVLIFISGDVDYVIEGKTYSLEPNDIVLVNHNEIHRPVINSSLPYERIIIYLSPGFLDLYKSDECDLSICFKNACRESSVLRTKTLKNNILFQSAKNLDEACSSSGYANELYCIVLFLEFMIQLNRACLSKKIEYLHTSVCNDKIVKIIKYINDNLTGDINIDCIAEKMFLSRYHMMRLFKKETGYTIGNYINEKRLLAAKEKLVKGMAVTEVCFDCGFKSYSAFFRAYKKLFGEAPKETAGNIKQ